MTTNWLIGWGCCRNKYVYIGGGSGMLSRVCFLSLSVMQLQLQLQLREVRCLRCLHLNATSRRAAIIYLIQRWETKTTTTAAAAATTTALHAFITAVAVALPLCQPDSLALSLSLRPSLCLVCPRAQSGSGSCLLFSVSIGARSACFLAALVRSARLACFQFRFQLRRVRQQLQQQPRHTQWQRNKYKKK